MLLLDTCTLLWMADDPGSLSLRAQELLEAETEGLLISSISAFEIALKHRKRRLELPCEPQEWLEEAVSYHDLEEIPVDIVLAVAANALPPLHDDPFDRIIVATARAHDVAVLTPDRLIAAYPDVVVQW